MLRILDIGIVWAMQNLQTRPAKIQAQMQHIETMLLEMNLVALKRPTDAAFQSGLPFCYDTMSFIEWLQWVMFPRTRELIDKQLPLPTVCEIHPLAEEECKHIKQDTTRLLASLLTLDQLFNVAH
ncbi:MAG: YqcC family protein [Arenicellales bacterium]